VPTQREKIEQIAFKKVQEEERLQGTLRGKLKEARTELSDVVERVQAMDESCQSGEEYIIQY
jgi:hypothetical protein